MADKQGSATDQVNQVRLVGRVSADPVQVELPSGDVVCEVRVVVDRPPSAVRGNARVDSVECSTFNGRLRRSMGSWSAGDTVEVTGALRCRFFRAGGALASRVQVELASARVIRRAETG